MPTEDELNAALNGSPEPEVVPEVIPETDEPEPEVHAEAEAPEVEHDEDEPEPESRRERRLQTLANEKLKAEAEAQFAKEQAERYRLMAEEAQRLANDQRQRDLDANLDPSEVRVRNAERQAQSATLAALDAGDRATFTNLLISQPGLAKYAPKVEEEIQKARAQGQYVTREGVLTYILGQEYRAQMSKSAKNRQASVEAVRSQRGKGTAPKSDSVGKKSESQAREERLSKMNI